MLGADADDRSLLIEEIHRPFAEKARHGQRLGAIIHALRFSDVLNSPVDEHGEEIADAHRFDVIVSDVENWTGKPLTDPNYFVAY